MPPAANTPVALSMLAGMAVGAVAIHGSLAPPDPWEPRRGAPSSFSFSILSDASSARVLPRARRRDADAFQGHSYTRVYVKVLGTFPSAALVLRLMATLRSGEGVPCGFRATGNPGGPGHQWVKARYIDPNPAGWEIQKFTYENP